jgi:hypothetical protein
MKKACLEFRSVVDPVSRIRCLFDPWSGMYNPERILFDGYLDPGFRIFLFRDG